MQNSSYINQTIELDIVKLPKDMQEIIKKLEYYDSIQDDIYYDSYYDLLESMGKNCLLEQRISNTQYSQIEKKYGGYA